MHWFRYTLVFSIPIAVLIGFEVEGWLKWSAALYTFGLIPLIELLANPQSDNRSSDDLRRLKSRKVYDVILFMQIPVVYVVGLVYLNDTYNIEMFSFPWFANTVGMGILLGAVGINVGHELGHRSSKWHKRAGLILLLSSQYMHFNIEHNHGHHLRVATPEDPASARRGEWLYVFWLRSVFMGWWSAFTIEQKRTRGAGSKAFRLNRVILFGAIQILFILAIYLGWGEQGALSYLAAAVIGILMLETVNYIEHYGLLRNKLPNGRYEPVKPWHSWNSDHPLGRMVLFELTRHSDHHHRASRKYQTLRSIDEAPNLPTGYPGMMLLSLVPPLFFSIVHPWIANEVGKLSDSK